MTDEQDFTGAIPVDPSSLVTEYAPIDDSLVYEVMIKELKLSPKPDKSGNAYMSAQFSVVEPDEWRDRVIFDSYIRLPQPITPDMSVGERRVAQDAGVQFARLFKCFKLSVGENGFVPSEAIGSMGRVTVKNETYEGKISSKVKEYLF